MRLHAHYFEPADFMFEKFLKLDAQTCGEKGLSRSKVIERRYYLMFWLSGLYVVLEGMEQMPIIAELQNRPLEIPMMTGRVLEIFADFHDHRSALRLLRNAQSHYQKTASKHLQFFEVRFRLEWAEQLHRTVKRFMSDYHIECAVICAFAGRTSEINIHRRYVHPSKHQSFFG